LDQAVRLFQKVLEMDPENVPMRVKLAEVYVRLGKKKEAWEIFSAAAEALRDLLKAYLQVGNSIKAAPIAEKLLTVHNDPEGLFLLAEGCTRLGQYHEALDVYTRHADRLLATDS